MKKSFLPLISMLGLALAAIGCGETSEQKPEVTGYKSYADPAYGFATRYPENWVEAHQTGQRIVAYSSLPVSDGFTTGEPKGNKGGKIEVFATEGAEAKRDELIETLRTTFAALPDAVKAPEQTNINGVPAVKIAYSYDIENGTMFTAERYFVVQDSMVTYFETAVIGTWDNYKAIFDTARAAFQPAKRQAVATPTTLGDTTVRDSIVVDPPSAETKSFSSSHFTISYPANFDATSRGGGLGSVNFSGTRNDANVVVDVFDGKNLELKGVAEKNQKTYGRAAQQASVAGQPAYVFNYGRGDVSSRAYFVLAGGKLYRITMNWYKPQENHYLPAFTKMLGSFNPK